MVKTGLKIVRAGGTLIRHRADLIDGGENGL